MRRQGTALYFVFNIGELWTPKGAVAAAGAAMQNITKLHGACLYIKDGRIAWVGEEGLLRASNSAIAREALDAAPYDAEGRSCIPGIVDSHTHFIFAGWREEEFFARPGSALHGYPPAGRRYPEQHARHPRCVPGRLDSSRQKAPRHNALHGDHHSGGQIRLWPRCGYRAPPALCNA